MIVAHFCLFIILFRLVNAEDASIGQAKCSCYMLGTIESKQGTSACNKQGICQCLPNIEGKNCDRCSPGFYGLLLYGGKCKPCGCSKLGSMSQDCDQNTGQCLCKKGFTGYHCEMCDFPEDLPYDSETPPCDVYRSVDPFSHDKNGNCECKPNVIGATCNECEANYYFNSTTAQCTKYSACFMFLREKLVHAQEHLEEMSAFITSHLNNVDKYNYEFLVNVHTLYKKIFDLLNTLLKKPHVQQVVKLKFLPTVLDLIERGIQDITFYLNGHINFNMLIKKVEELKNIYNNIKIKPDEMFGDKSLDEVSNKIQHEIDVIFENISKLQKKQEILIETVDRNHNNAINEMKIADIEEKQLELEMFLSNPQKIHVAYKLLNRTREAQMVARNNKKKATHYYNEAMNLTLPINEEHHVEEIIFPIFNDLSERIEKAKLKYDFVNDILEDLNTHENSDGIQGISGIENKIKDLFSSVDKIQKYLNKKLEENSKLRKDLYAEKEVSDKNIKSLNSDIDKAEKEIHNNLEKLQNLRKLLRLHKQYLITKKEVLKLIIEADKERMQLREEINTWKDLISFMKELIKYLELIHHVLDNSDEINELLNEYETYFKNIKYLQDKKNEMKAEVGKLEVLLNSLIIENPQECRIKGPTA